MKQVRKNCDPLEWDFRSTESRELPAAVVYEYARSCPAVANPWLEWLESTIPTCREIELDEPTVVYDEQNRVRVADVFKQEYSSGIPAWPRDATAELLVRSLPQFFRDIAVEPLIFCTPSFGVPWSKVPIKEREAVVSLLQPPLSRPVRDAKDKPDPGEHVFRLAIDIDQAMPTEIHKGFQQWLKSKLWEFEKQNPEAVLGALKANPGRSAAPPYEHLTWLGAYRMQLSGLSYKEALEILTHRRDDPKHPNPAVGRFPKLPIYEAEDGWYKAIAKAGRLMKKKFTPSEDMFRRSIFHRLW